MCVPGERGHGRCFGLQVLLLLSTVVPVILALCDVNARQVHHVVLVTTMPSDAVRRTGSRQQQGSVRMRAPSTYITYTGGTTRTHKENNAGRTFTGRRTEKTNSTSHRQHQHRTCAEPQKHSACRNTSTARAPNHRTQRVAQEQHTTVARSTRKINRLGAHDRPLAADLVPLLALFQRQVHKHHVVL